MRKLKTKDSKVFVKVYDNTHNNYRWIHLCYVNTSLLNQFMLENPEVNMCARLEEWFQRDFGRSMSLLTAGDVKAMKDQVREMYRGKYPDLFRDSYSDRQGWFRVWVTKNMSEEVDYGKLSV